MQTKKILITGGAGFIGSYVNKLLNQHGHETVVVDNLSRGYRNAVVCGDFVEGAIGDRPLLKELFEKHRFDAVFHFAAHIDVAESVKHPFKYYNNNFFNSLVLFEEMLAHGVKNLIFSSTAAVYGIPQKKTISEEHPCFPINPYGKSKWMVESALADLDRAHGLKSCTLRYFNAAGGDPEKILSFPQKPSHLIPAALSSLIDKTPLTIFGTDYATRDGTAVRDYIHLHDLAEAHILGMNRLFKEGASECFNLGNGQGFTVKEVIAAVERVTGMPINAIEGERREGDPPILLADSTRAEKQLGWKRKYPEIEAMISHAWQSQVACSA